MKNYLATLFVLCCISITAQTLDKSTGYQSTGLTTTQLNNLPLSQKLGLTIRDITLGYVVTWDENLGVFIKTGGGLSYGASSQIGSSAATLDFDLGSIRRIELTHTATASTINFTNKTSAAGEPIILQLSSSNASGTTFTFDAETFDVNGLSAFSVSVAQNENITIHFVVISSGQVFATNYPTGSAGTVDQSAAYNWTGLHDFQANTDFFTGIDLNSSSIERASDIEVQPNGFVQIGDDTEINFGTIFRGSLGWNSTNSRLELFTNVETFIADINSKEYDFDGTYDDANDVPTKTDIDAAISGLGSSTYTAPENFVLSTGTNVLTDANIHNGAASIINVLNVAGTGTAEISNLNPTEIDIFNFNVDLDGAILEITNAGTWSSSDIGSNTAVRLTGEGAAVTFEETGANTGGFRIYAGSGVSYFTPDTTPPLVTSATIESANPNQLVVLFDEAVNVIDVTGLSLDGTLSGLTFTGIISNVNNEIIFQLSGNAASGNSGNFVYGATNTITDLAGNSLVASSTAVTNNIGPANIYAANDAAGPTESNTVNSAYWFEQVAGASPITSSATNPRTGLYNIRVTRSATNVTEPDLRLPVTANTTYSASLWIAYNDNATGDTAEIRVRTTNGATANQTIALTNTGSVYQEYTFTFTTDVGITSFDIGFKFNGINAGNFLDIDDIVITPQ